MKVNELRIGNYYQNNNDVVKLDSSLLISYLQKETDLRLNPIQLNEEWLLKFGFFIIPQDDGFEAYQKNIRYSVKKNKIFDWFLFCDGDKVLTDFKYAHELQTLFFTLTNIEL